jgi:hypothetical protein
VCDRFQVRLQLKLGENNGLVTTVCTGMADDHKRIDMTLWKKTESYPGKGCFSSAASAIFILIGLYLESVGDHIAMRDLHTFLFSLSIQVPISGMSNTYRQTRCATRVAQESCSASSLSGTPSQLLDCWGRFPSIQELVNGLKIRWRLRASENLFG